MTVESRSTAAASLEALFARHDDRRDVHRRSRLHRAGDPLHHACLILQGWFGRFRTGLSGAEAVTAIYLPGDIIGLDALFDARFADDLVVLSDGAVLRLPLDKLREAVAAGGGVALEAARLLAADSGFLREALFAVGTQSSFERLSTFIIQTYDRLVAAGLLAPGIDRFAMPLTQAQLGAVTGLTSVHVNRVLKQLRLAGLLEVRGGTVHVTNLPGLRRAAQRRPEPRQPASAAGQAFA